MHAGILEPLALDRVILNIRWTKQRCHVVARHRGFEKASLMLPEPRQHVGTNAASMA